MAVLFPHNAEAYQAALDMLRDCGKAAVIHPTGTGKSFIAFQLAADHPESRVLWLSPSEYIFQTQLENWTRASYSTPVNISFCTYARLMLLSPEDLNALQPDTIVLDELMIYPLFFYSCLEIWRIYYFGTSLAEILLVLVFGCYLFVKSSFEYHDAI